MKKDSKTGRVVRDDLTGQVHDNGTTVVRYHSPTKNGGSKWVVLCGCPDKTEMVVWAESFKRGVVCRKCRNEILRKKRTKHGGRYTPDYRVWVSMNQRCFNKNHADYPAYGGAGVTVDERWHRDNPHGFENFTADMGKRPEGVWFIHRYPPDASYGPKTARWATREEQDNERRNSKYLTFQGKKQTYAQWGRETGIDKTTIRDRVLNGWPVERVLSKADGRTSYTITHNGKTQTLTEWVKETGIPKSTLINRMKRGLTGDDLFAP